MKANRCSARTVLKRAGHASLLGCALVLWGASGLASDDDDRFGTFTDPNGEEVGTLPSVTSSTSIWMPALVLTGPQAGVQGLVAQVSGLDPAAGVTTLPDGSARVVFYGEVSLTLDRAELATAGVDVTLQVGPLFAGGLSQLAWNGVATHVQALPAGDLRLGLDRLDETVGIDGAAGQWKLLNPYRMAATIDVKVQGDRIRLDVQHPE